MSEFTFQVAMRNAVSSGLSLDVPRLYSDPRASWSGVHDHEEELGLASRLTPYRRTTVAGARTRRQATEGHLEVEHLAGAYLSAKASPVYSPEQREPPRVALVCKDGDPAKLGQRLDHEHAGKSGPAGEMTTEEGLLPGRAPATSRRLTGFERGDIVDEEERGAMGKEVLRAKHTPRLVAAQHPGVPNAEFDEPEAHSS